MGLPSFFKELRKRNVYKVATVYAITAWLVAQIIALTANAFSAPSWVMKMVIVILIAGFPVALILAWAFELTPEGIKRTSTLSHSEKIVPKKGHLNTWIIGLLAAALVFLGAERIFFAESTILGDEPGNANKASIAVLPFEDFSPNSDQQYFADGISEELLNVLTGIEGIKVPGRTSSFQFRDKETGLKEIGQILEVDHILEGSIRKSGDDIRVTAKLVKSEDGSYVWSKTYDRAYTAENIFAIQDEISRQVLQELKVRLLSENNTLKTSTTTNTEAYDLYLQAISIIQSFNPGDIERGITLLNRASELDPDFALAYAKKSQALIWLNIFGNLSYKDMVIQAREAADTALFLNRDLPEAYAALGLIKWIQNNYEQSLAAFDLAISLKPGDAEMRAARAMPLLLTGDYEKANKELKYAYKLDPLSPIVNINFGWHYFYRKEMSKAEKYFQNAIKINPDILAGYDGLSWLYHRQGRLDKAFITYHRSFKKIKEPNPANLEGFISVANELELEQFAEKHFRTLEKEFPNNLITYYVKADRMMKKRNYQEMIDYTKEFELRTAGITEDRYVENLAHANLELGNYKEVVELMKNRHPDALRTDTLNMEARNFAIVFYTAVALRNSGERTKADLIIKNACNFLKKKDKEETILMSEEVYDWDLAACSGLLGDKETVYEFLKERIQNQNLAQHHYVYGLFNDQFMRLTESEIAPYREKEKTILKEQQQKVISYLKEQEEWKKSSENSLISG